MKRSKRWLPIALGTALLVAASAHADFVCPVCDAQPALAVGTRELVGLVLSTVLQRGVTVLLLSATAVVGLPWLLAGIVAATAIHLPRWLKVW